MALKRKISKESYEKLTSDLKAEYVEKDGEFILEIEGDVTEDTGALKRAKDRESQLRRDAEKRATEAESRLEEIEGNDARKSGDIETLEKSWKKKNQDLETDFQNKLSKKNSFIQTTLVDNVASKMAHKISTNPSLIMPHIKSRLKADFDGETPLTKVLDANGELSSLSIEELEKEFLANKDFSPIILGSKASGSSTSNDGKNRSNRVSATGNDKPLDLSGLSPKEFAEQLKASKEQRE